MKISVSALFAFAILTAASAHGSPLMEDTTHVNVQVANASHHAIWVDISGGHSMSKWTVEKAFCLEHGQSAHYTLRIENIITSGTPQMRVRAEIKRTDCSSSNIRVLEAKADYGHGKTYSAAVFVGETQIVFHKP